MIPLVKILYPYTFGPGVPILRSIGILLIMLNQVNLIDLNGYYHTIMRTCIERDLQQLESAALREEERNSIKSQVVSGFYIKISNSIRI